MPRRYYRVTGPSAGFMIIGIFLFIGVLMLVFAGLFYHFEKQQIKRCTEPAEAVVTEMVGKIDDESGKKLYSPIFSYSVNGKVYEVQYSEYSSPAKYEVGDKADLLYDPDDPKYFRIDSDSMSTFKILYLVFGGFGILFTAIPLIILFVLIATIRSANKPQDDIY